MTALRAGAVSHRLTSLELAPLDTAASCARLHAVHVLHEWGLGGLAEDAALIVSELITNATDASVVLPESPPVALRLQASDGLVLIEVWDQSPADPEPHEADDDDVCGRGLAVVAALSAR
jgi:anti-sigma regulatory factor (Ser/Thr protein kinase)